MITPRRDAPNMPQGERLWDNVLRCFKTGSEDGYRLAEARLKKSPSEGSLAVLKTLAGRPSATSVDPKEKERLQDIKLTAIRQATEYLSACRQNTLLGATASLHGASMPDLTQAAAVSSDSARNP